MNGLPPVGPSSGAKGAQPAKGPELPRADLNGPYSVNVGDNAKYSVAIKNVDPKKVKVNWEIYPPVAGAEIAQVNNKESIDFQPNEIGNWSIRVTLTDLNGKQLSTVEMRVTVLPPPKEK